MSHSLFLFTGENTFALSEEVRRWKSEFAKKHGDSNLQVLDSKTPWSEIMDLSSVAPFLGDKRLLVIEGIPKVKKEELEALIASMHPETIVAFVEPKPDARTSAVKFLQKNATEKKFPLLSESKLIAWLQSIAAEHGTTMEHRVAQELISIVGTNQWHLLSEAKKVILHALPKPPTSTDIEAICIPTSEQTIWILSDLIGKGKHTEAVSHTALLHERGENAHSLWNIFLWIARNMMGVWMYATEKNLPVGAISKEAGIPFPSVRSLYPAVTKMKREEIQEFAASVVESEIAVKTGLIKGTAEDGTEVLAVLEQSLLELKHS